MSSRAAAGRKRLQQPKAEKSSSFKSSRFIKSFTNDKKKSSSSLPSLSLPPSTLDSTSFQHPHGHSDPSVGDPLTSAGSAPTDTHWGDPAPNRRPGTSDSDVSVSPSSHPYAGPPRTFNPYPSPPISQDDIHAQSSLASDGTLSPSHSLLSSDSSSGLACGASPAFTLSTLPNNHPSSPSSHSDSLSPQTLSPVMTNHSALSSIVYSERSSDSTSTASSGVVSSAETSAEPPLSVSTKSSSSSKFVYPSSRSVGRPAPGGPKFGTKSKKAIAESTAISAECERPPALYRTTSSVGRRLSVVGPSSISAPSLRSSFSSNSSGSAQSSDSGFVFPTTRSRGHPREIPRRFRKQNGEDEVNISTSKFMGLSLSRKKKGGSKSLFPPIPEVPSQPTSKDDLATPVPASVVLEDEVPPIQIDLDVPPLPRVPTKLGVYPLDSRDPTLLESDKATFTLLQRLNTTDTPSFCLYGNEPPSSVLDLGCGQGHWLLEAAIHWKGYGTQFTGLDIADTMKIIRPLAMENGVADNIEFVRCNFLKQRLPFADESFDLVRMSNLTYSISFDKWDFVLGEVCRVLTIGGRLEFIDDHIFFPYANPLPSPSPSLSDLSSREREDAVVYDTIGRGPNDENEVPDTATLPGNRAGSTSASQPATTNLNVPSIESQFWTDQMESSRELETLFEHLMNLKYGIHLCPSEFMLEMMEQIFGYAREVKTMHLTIALPDSQSYSNTTNSSAMPLESLDRLDGSPGLLLWPSTLIPMSSAELQTHALKHPRTLLSCKAALSDYASETLGVELEDNLVMEAMWEYEGFLQSRLSPPPPTIETVAVPSSPSVDTISEFRPEHASNRVSVYSTSSITSEDRSAMWDYDFELRHHFAWPLDNESITETIRARAIVNSTTLDTVSASNAEEESAETNTISSDVPPSFCSQVPTITQRTARQSMMPPPDYCVTESTHCRTFHVYEAIKMSPGLLTPI